MKILTPQKDDETTMTGTGFSVDNNNLVHIISLLTKIYSNPIKAVVQELFCNAYDSHVEKYGSDFRTKIKITTPSLKNQFWTIQDFGIGMTLESFQNIYTNYGNSTKRSSNSLIGYFGIGSKSPFAVVKSYDVIIGDGFTKYHFLMFIKNELPSYTLISQEKDDYCGVTIKIPVQTNEMNKWIQATTSFLELMDNSRYETTCIVKPLTIKNTFKNSKNLKIYEVDRKEETFYIRLGIVNYPLNTANFNSLSSFSSWAMKSSFILQAELGKVTISPSRENLIYDDITINYINSLIKLFLDCAITQIQDKINEFSTKIEAQIYLLQQNSLLIKGHDFFYKDEELSKIGLDCKGVFYNSSGFSRTCSPEKPLTLDNYDGIKFVQTTQYQVRDKVEHLFKEYGINAVIVLYEEMEVPTEMMLSLDGYVNKKRVKQDLRVDFAMMSSHSSGVNYNETSVNDLPDKCYYIIHDIKNGLMINGQRFSWSWYQTIAQNLPEKIYPIIFANNKILEKIKGVELICFSNVLAELYFDQFVEKIKEYYDEFLSFAGLAQTKYLYYNQYHIVKYFVENHQGLIPNKNDLLQKINFNSNRYYRNGTFMVLRQFINDEKSKELIQKLLNHPVIVDIMGSIDKCFTHISKKYPMLMVLSGRITDEEKMIIVENYVKEQNSKEN